MHRVIDLRFGAITQQTTGYWESAGVDRTPSALDWYRRRSSHVSETATRPIVAVAGRPRHPVQPRGPRRTA